MISIASRVPPPFIDAIGPAPGYGRRSLARAHGATRSGRQPWARSKLIEKAEFTALETDKRFEAVHNELRAKVSRVRSEPWTADDGTRLAHVTQTERSSR